MKKGRKWTTIHSPGAEAHQHTIMCSRREKKLLKTHSNRKRIETEAKLTIFLFNQFRGKGI